MFGKIFDMHPAEFGPIHPLFMDNFQVAFFFHIQNLLKIQRRENTLDILSDSQVADQLGQRLVFPHQFSRTIKNSVRHLQFMKQFFLYLTILKSEIDQFFRDRRFGIEGYHHRKYQMYQKEHAHQSAGLMVDHRDSQRHNPDDDIQYNRPSQVPFQTPFDFHIIFHYLTSFF